MSGPKASHLLSLLLTVSAASIAGLIYSDAWRLPEAPPTVPRAAPTQVAESSAESPPGETTPPALQEFSEIIARPLFTADRRPDRPSAQETVTQAPVSAPVSPSSDQFRVMGIVISEDAKTALIKPVGQNSEIQRVKEGQVVSGWKVTAIEPEAVTVTQGGRSEIIKLSDNVLSAAEKRRLEQQAKRSENMENRKTPVKRIIRRPPNRRSPRTIDRPTPNRIPTPPSRPPLLRKPPAG